MSDEEIIARKLYGAYGAGALGQARTCASLARVMADKPSTSIWNNVIAILTEYMMCRCPDGTEGWPPYSV